DGDVLGDAADVGADDRRIAGPGVGRRLTGPQDRCGVLVERDHACLLAAGHADELVAVDERRLAEAPARHHPAAEFLDEVLLPEQRPLRGVEAEKHAIRSERVELLAIDGRRASAAGAVRVVEVGPDLRLPEHLSGLLVETDDKGVTLLARLLLRG